MKPFAFIAKPNDDGARHFIGLSSSGQAFSWGQNNLGQLGRGTSTNKTPGPVDLEDEENATVFFARAFVGGGSDSGHSALLDANGSLWLAGCDRWQQLGLGSSAGGSSGYTWNQGRVWRTKFVRNDFLTCIMEGSIRDVALGGDHTVVLSSNQRDVYVFGKGGDGQLGLDGNPFVSAPTRSKLLSSKKGGIAAVCAIQNCSVTLDKNGRIMAKTGKCRKFAASWEHCIRRAALDGLVSVVEGGS